MEMNAKDVIQSIGELTGTPTQAEDPYGNPAQPWPYMRRRKWDTLCVDAFWAAATHRLSTLQRSGEWTLGLEYTGAGNDFDLIISVNHRGEEWGSMNTKIEFDLPDIKIGTKWEFDGDWKDLPFHKKLEAHVKKVCKGFRPQLPDEYEVADLEEAGKQFAVNLDFSIRV